MINSTDAICESFQDSFLKHLDFIPERDQIAPLIGYTLEDIVEKILLFYEKPYNTAMIDSIVEGYKQYYQHICNPKTTLLPHALEAITLAKQFARLGIVTTKTRVGSLRILTHLKIQHFFECIIGRESVTHPKPDAEPIFKALEEMKIPIEARMEYKIAMIGDTPLDIMAAKNANVMGIGVTSGYSSKDMLLKYTDKITNNALEATLLFKKIFTF